MGIPEIKIRKKYWNTSGIQIMKISELKNHKLPKSHNPYQPHRLKFHLIIVVQNGPRGEHCINFQNYAYQKNSLIFITENQIHNFIDLAKNNDGFLIVFSEAVSWKFSMSVPMVTQHFYDYNILHEPVIHFTQGEMEKIIWWCTSLKMEKEKPHFFTQEYVLHSYLQLILFEIFENIKKNQHQTKINSNSLKIFADFQRLVKENIKYEKNTLFYTRTLNISLKKLNTITKEVSQLTAKQYIIQSIIIEAKYYLKWTDISNKKVSWLLGFSDPSHFNKFFKRYTGMTPGDFSNT